MTHLDKMRLRRFQPRERIQCEAHPGPILLLRLDVVERVELGNVHAKVLHQRQLPTQKLPPNHNNTPKKTPHLRVQYPEMTHRVQPGPRQHVHERPQDGRLLAHTHLEPPDPQIVTAGRSDAQSPSSQHAGHCFRKPGSFGSCTGPLSWQTSHGTCGSSSSTMVSDSTSLKRSWS